MEPFGNGLPYEIKVDGENKKCLESKLTDSITESTNFEQLNSTLLPKILSLTLTEPKRSMTEPSILDGPADIDDNKVLDTLMENIDTVMHEQTSLENVLDHLQVKNDIQESEQQPSMVETLVKQIEMSTLIVSSTSQVVQQNTRNSDIEIEKIPLIRYLSTETLIKMFKFLNYGDLSGCALVNKSWWYAAIHILWSEPFEFISERDFKSETKQEKFCYLMRVYIGCLKVDVKRKLIESGISLTNEYLSKPTYNYTTFLQNLDIGFLYSACREWRQWLCRQEGNSFDEIMSDAVKNQQFLVYREICKMFIRTSRSIKKFYLDELEYSGFQCFDLLPMDPELRHLITLPGATGCLSELTYFSCDGCVPRELIKGLAELCHNIEHLSFHGCINIGGLSGIFPLILTQKKLRHLTLIGNMGYCNAPNLITVSHAIKNIEHLTLVGTVNLAMKLFVHCRDIKYLELYDENMESNTCKILQFIDAPSLKVERLILRIYCKESHIIGLVDIIKHANINLKMIDLEWRVHNSECFGNTNHILRNIASHCQNLLVLKLPLLFYNEEIFDLFMEVLRRCQKLVYLGIIRPSIFRYSKILLDIASELPPNLEFFYYDTIPKHCEENLLCEFFYNIVKNLGRAITVEWNPFNQEHHNRIINEYVDTGNIILKKLNEENVFPHVGFDSFHHRKSLRGKFDLHITRSELTGL